MAGFIDYYRSGVVDAIESELYLSIAPGGFATCGWQ